MTRETIERQQAVSNDVAGALECRGLWMTLQRRQMTGKHFFLLRVECSQWNGKATTKSMKAGPLTHNW